MTYIVYTATKSKKKRPNTAAKRQLQSDWNDLMNKWGKLEKRNVNTRKDYRGNQLPDLRGFRDIPSVGDGVGTAVKKDVQVYTGDSMIGIATMHKSNSVPVFKKEDAEAISQMRR